MGFERHPALVNQARSGLGPTGFDPAQGDLVQLIEARLQLVDSLNAAWERRRAARPIGQQNYRDRAERNHRARMAAATAFEGESK